MVGTGRRIVSAIAVSVTVGVAIAALWCASGSAAEPTSPPAAGKKIPRLLDLGSKSCIPCKAMAPILEELKKDYEGRFQVEFIDVWVKENAKAAKEHGIKLIPTQIFFDASGKELWRHEGFFSKEDILAKWRELGFEFRAAPAPAPAFERLVPAKADDRPKDRICYLCDGDIVPRTKVTVQTEKGAVGLCSPHCYWILNSCLTEDKTGLEARVSVTDAATGEAVPAARAVYLCGMDEQSGRPTTKAFVLREAAEKERRETGGNLLGWQALGAKELAARCGFCDRAVYPEDAAAVRVGGLHTWGCCSHCALGVAARTGKDIEVHQKDRLTGAMIVVKTLDGNIASLDPPTAVAWFGLRKGPQDSWVSAGCFHQGFFATAENLKRWVDSQPFATGKQISIAQALADKMQLSPQQILKACKIGECAPK